MATIDRHNQIPVELNSFTAMGADPRPIFECHVGSIIFLQENIWQVERHMYLKLRFSPFNTYKGEAKRWITKVPMINSSHQVKNLFQFLETLLSDHAPNM